jgi:RNA polymerase sigma-70 factor (ECF subfamily)
MNTDRCREYLVGIAAGSQDALTLLYDETSGLLFSLALRLLNSRADAEEVVLDVYKQVWRSAGTFDSSRANVVSWLALLTRSRAIDRLRQANSRRAWEMPFENMAEPRGSTPAPEAQLMFHQERKLVRRALADLSPEQREVIELAFFEGLTHVEVAEKLGAPLGTIKTRIRTGMQRLRKSLEPSVQHATLFA